MRSDLERVDMEARLNARSSWPRKNGGESARIDLGKSPSLSFVCTFVSLFFG